MVRLVKRGFIQMRLHSDITEIIKLLKELSTLSVKQMGKNICEQVNELASFISEKSKTSFLSEVKDDFSNSINAEKVIPLSLGQQGLWMHQKTYPSSYAYNVPVCLKLGESIQIEKFEQAVKMLIQLNPILNSIIIREKDICATLRGETHSLFENADVVIADGKLEDYLKEFFKRPFVMGQDLVTRIAFVTLNKTDRKERYFIACIHHIVLDGFSLELLTTNACRILYKYFTCAVFP